MKMLVLALIYPLHTGTMLETPAKSENQDEMQHHTAFHQGLHCLPRLKQQGQKCIIILKILPVTMNNGQSHTDYINMYGTINRLKRPVLLKFHNLGCTDGYHISTIFCNFPKFVVSYVFSSI